MFDNPIVDHRDHPIVDHPVRLFVSVSSELSAALAEAVGLAFEEQDVAVVGEAVEQRRGEGGIAEDLAPAPELEVAGDQHRVALSTPVSN